jgi:hypothetical protein
VLQIRRARCGDSAQIVTPFVQVGTSCQGFGDRKVPDLFNPRFPAAQTIRSPDRSELRISLPWAPGPASYGTVRFHPGFSPLSRYGDLLAKALPSVLPAAPLLGSGDREVPGLIWHREGSTDLSWKCGRDRSRPGQFHLPDKEFRLILLLQSPLWARGAVISADLCMSPCSPDSLFELTSARQIVWR